MCTVYFNQRDMSYHVVDLDTMETIDTFDDPMIAYEYSSSLNQD